MMKNSIFKIFTRSLIFSIGFIFSLIITSIVLAISSLPSTPEGEFDGGMFGFYLEQMLSVSDISLYTGNGKVNNTDTLSGVDSLGLQVKIGPDCPTGKFLTSVSTDGRLGCDGVAPPVGICGTSSGLTIGSAPGASTLCDTNSTASAVSGSGPWSWTCTNGTTVDCEAYMANGKCGSASGASLTDRPSSGSRCARGNVASNVTTVGNKYQWTCTNGTTVNCSARKCTCGGLPDHLVSTITPLIYTYDITNDTSRTCLNNLQPLDSSCAGVFYHLKSSNKNFVSDPMTLTCEYYWIRLYQYPMICN